MIRLGKTALSAACFLLLTQAAPAQSEWPKPTSFSGHFDPQYGAIIAAQNGKVLWSFGATDPATQGHEVQILHVSYYLEPLDGSSPPKEIYHARSLTSRAAATFLPDGTILLTSMHSLVWLETNQPPREESVPELKANTLYPVNLFPDGVVAIESTSGKFAKAWWLPIENHALLLDKRILLDDAVDNDEIFLRHGNQIAWLNAAHLDDSIPKPKRRPPQFSTFNLDGGAIHHFPVAVDSATRLLAFDGAHAIAGGGTLIDPATGKINKIPLNAQPLALDQNTLYLRHDIRAADSQYIVNQFEILALDLTNPATPKTLATLDLTKFIPQTRRNAINPQNCILVSDNKIWFWDFAHWQSVPPTPAK